MFQLHYVVPKSLNSSKAILELIFNRKCLLLGSMVYPSPFNVVGLVRVALISLSQLFLVFIII